MHNMYCRCTSLLKIIEVYLKSLLNCNKAKYMPWTENYKEIKNTLSFLHQCIICTMYCKTWNVFLLKIKYDDASNCFHVILNYTKARRKRTRSLFTKSLYQTYYWILIKLKINSCFSPLDIIVYSWCLFSFSESLSSMQIKH